MNDEHVIQRVELDCVRLRELGFLFQEGEDHTPRWNRHFRRGSKRLFLKGGGIEREILRNFWRNRIFITDNPKGPTRPWPLRILGRVRGEVEMLETLRRSIRRSGYKDLLQKYPCPSAGNPHLYRTGKCTYTHRWAKHIYHLGQTNRFLKPHLGEGFVALDIGAGQGLFSCLLHQEYGGSHQVLVDLPEQLLLARYMIEMTFPEARVAGISDLPPAESLSREWLKSFDFVLLPWQLYKDLPRGSVDLVTSFAALGELTRTFFDYYTKASVFAGARLFYSVNPVRSEGFHGGSDLTLLDYPIHDKEKCLYIGLSPIFKYPYSDPKVRHLFFYSLRQFTPFLEYVGWLQDSPLQRMPV